MNTEASKQIKNEGVYSGMCEDCGKVNTSCKDDDGTFVCAVCSNARYYKKLERREIIELRLDMTKLKQSTFLKIKALIQEDYENHI